MFDLAKMFGRHKEAGWLNRDEIAALLRTTPEALEAFENAYMEKVSKETPENADSCFGINSRQAAEMRKNAETDSAENADIDVNVDDMIRCIVDELLYLAPTKRYVYNGKTGKSETFQDVKKNTECKEENREPDRRVSSAELKALPQEVRPQLTGMMAQKDIEAESASTVLYMYKKFLDTGDKMAYHMFRQGLDILDLDPILYEMLGMNRNSMGYWLPSLVSAVSGQPDPFFKIPKTTVVQVPITLLQMTRTGYAALNATTLRIADEWAMKAFDLDPSDPNGYFIKTGTYSSKFDFRNAKVTDPGEIREIGEYLLYIHAQANEMAGPLTQPSIYGVSTCREWAVREFIHDLPDSTGDSAVTDTDVERTDHDKACIYHGLKLHNELRAFVDFDQKEVLGIFQYWDPDVMKQRFGHGSDRDDPDKIHDYIIYAAFEEELKKRFGETKDLIQKELEKIIPDIPLTGQWSIDIMEQNAGNRFGGGDFYLIDMALAGNSAFRERIPVGKRRMPEENWLPEISG